MPGIIPGNENPSDIARENTNAATGKGQITPTKAANVAGNTASPCIISSPSLPLVGSVGGGCLLSKTNVRAMVGGLIFGIGSVVTVAGLALLAAAGFGKTGAASKMADVAGAFPGPAGQAAALGLRAASGRATGRASERTRTAIRTRRTAGATEERRQMRQVGEPKENRNLRVGKGAVRETPQGTRRRKAETGTSTKPASREEAGF